MRGTVTPLSESISVEDARKVAKKVEEAIETQIKQLKTLQGFADENRSLRKLLLELPDLVSYNIMVPFGKAAYMPGRLIHTNEFLVLLGEGYYAERSAKQAAEILMRRSEFIKAKIDALNNQIKDLEAEASFAKDTAAEAASGLVEIREPYMESTMQPAGKRSDINNVESIATKDDKETDSDPEHSRIMARLAELELAEAAAGEDDDDDVGGDDDDDEEMMETNLRASFRNSLLGDSDETDEDEDEEEDEYDDDDEESEQVDLSNRTAANTLLNRSSVHLSEIDGREEFHSSIIQDQPRSQVPEQGTQSDGYPALKAGEQIQKRKVQFQSTIISSQDGSQVQAREQGIHSLGYPATKANEWNRDEISKGESIAASPSSEQLPPVQIKPSPAQLRAFTGSVMERNTEHLSSVTPLAPEVPPSRPVSKFKQRKG